MDARGFGRTDGGSRRHRILAVVTALVSLVSLMFFAYDLVAGILPILRVGSLVTLHLRDLLVVVGLVAAFVSVRLSGHGVRRSRYRPDRWLLPELLTVACGFVPVAAIVAIGAGPEAASLYPTVLPILDMPMPVPAAMLVAALVALLPAVLTPPALTAAVEVTA